VRSSWFLSASKTLSRGYSLYFLCPAALFITLVVLTSRMERLGAYSIADTLSIIFSPRDLRAISLLHRLRRSTSVLEEKSVIEALADTPSEISIGDVLTKLKSPRFTIRVEALAAELPADRLRVAESGIRDPADVVRLHRAGYDAFLVGEHLVRAEDPAAALRNLLHSA